MEPPADILIVAREDDRVAIRLRRALEERSRRVIQLDGPSAARIFTIRVQSDSTIVAPSVPMFIRASAWWSDVAPETPDDRFLRAEEYATFWAAAALCDAPVVNRPGRHGGVGRMTWGAIARAQNLRPERERCEIFASGPEMVTHLDDAMWAEDPNYVSAPIGSLQARLPVRARKISADALYEIITVVGQRAFSATTDPSTVRLDLINRSLTLARQVDVHFATVTWAIDDGGATAVRLNDAPDEAELRYSWSEVVEALCLDLMQ
jgi:hypothetical protein